MAKTNCIELGTGEQIPILYEDRAVLAIDKPRGWMLAPSGWQKTSRNLQLALTSSIRAGDFWARSRNLKYVRFIHRLDAGTTGVLLLAKSPGALARLSELFQTRRMEKVYLAAVQGAPAQREWECHFKLGQDPRRPGRVKVDAAQGKAAETRFRVLQASQKRALLEVHPLTGRMHQIRVHLAHSGHPVVGDDLYGPPRSSPEGLSLALRAIELSYLDPFTSRPVQVRAPVDDFIREYGFEVPTETGGS